MEGTENCWDATMDLEDKMHVTEKVDAEGTVGSCLMRKKVRQRKNREGKGLGSAY